jgi:hypothetical protein
MPATFKEFLSEICADSSALFANEESTKFGVVQPILSFLGWNNSREVRPEFPVRSDRVDYCLMSGPRKVFIEAKVAGTNLNGHQQQLLGYAFGSGVELAALTTGLEWWLYLPLKRGTWQERRFAVIDVQKDDDAADRLTTFLSRRAILDGSAFQAAEKAIIDKNLPRVWNELFMEQRDSLVESLGTKLRDQTGYEPLRPHLEYFLDRQVGRSSGPTQGMSGTPQDTGSANPVQPGSRLALIPETSQPTNKGPGAPYPPVAIMPLLEEIRQAVTGPSFPKAEWYATQTPDYRARAVLNDDLSRVFVRVTWTKDWVWVKLKDVGKYKVSKPGEVDKLRDQIQAAYQKAEQHLLRSAQSSGPHNLARRKPAPGQMFPSGTNNDRIYSILKDGVFHDMGELAAVASSGMSTAKAVIKYFAKTAPSKWNFQVEQQGDQVRIVQLQKGGS